MLALVQAFAGTFRTVVVGDGLAAADFRDAGAEYESFSSSSMKSDAILDYALARGWPRPAEAAMSNLADRLPHLEEALVAGRRHKANLVFYDVAEVLGLAMSCALSVPALAFSPFGSYMNLPEAAVCDVGVSDPVAIALKQQYHAAVGKPFLDQLPNYMVFPPATRTIVPSIEQLSRSTDSCARLAAAYRTAIEGLVYIGACVGGPRTRASLGHADLTEADGSEAMAWICRQRAHGRQIVLCSLGTIVPFEEHRAGSAPSGKAFARCLVERVLGAIRTRANVACVVADAGVSGRSGTIDGRCLFAPYVPQTEILPYADVFVTHCGPASAVESLIAGVPMVAVPAIGDQIAVASALLKNGAAHALWSLNDVFREATTAALGSAVDAVLANQRGYSSAVDLLGKKLRSAGGQAAAVNLAADLLSANVKDSASRTKGLWGRRSSGAISGLTT